MLAFRDAIIFKITDLIECKVETISTLLQVGASLSLMD
jgi:hypothetical protein